MTKEPKLQAAMRIVPEWQDYDQEIKLLQGLFQKEKETGIQAKTPVQHTGGNLSDHFPTFVTFFLPVLTGVKLHTRVSLHHTKACMEDLLNNLYILTGQKGLAERGWYNLT